MTIKVNPYNNGLYKQQHFQGLNSNKNNTANLISSPIATINVDNTSFTSALKAQRLYASAPYISFAGNIQKLKADVPIDKTLFDPAGVVVIGASSSKPDSIGSTLFSSLVNSGYTGNIVAVNPSGKVAYYDENRKLTTYDKSSNNAENNISSYTTIDQIPVAVDTAIVSVPTDYVLQVVENCAKKGIKNVVVITNNFAETGNVELQNKLVEICQKNNIVLVGPNCMGVESLKYRSNFSPILFDKGDVAVFSQSGSMGVVIANYLRNLLLGSSAFLSLGNKAGVAEEELLNYFKNDPTTKVVLGYLEGINNPDKFLDALIKTSLEKPVIIVKAGRSKSGGKATAAHTGSAAGSDGIADAIIARGGGIRAKTNRALSLYTQAFDTCPLPKGNRVAVITNGGGEGIMTSDSVEDDHGTILKLTNFDDDFQTELKKMLPDGASARNPVDTVASVTNDQYLKALEKLIMRDDVDSAIAYSIPLGDNVSKRREFLSALTDLQNKYGKPIMPVPLMKKEYIEDLNAFRAESKTPILPLYEVPEDAVEALSRLVMYSNWKKKVANNPELLNPTMIKETPISDDAKNIIKSIIKAAVDKGDAVLTTNDAMKILSAYGVNIGKFAEASKISVENNIKEMERIAPLTEFFMDSGMSSEQLEDTAIRIALNKVVTENAINYPVVMKISATGEVASHKSDVGGVILEIKNLDELVNAYKTIMKNVRSAEIKGQKVKEEDIIGVQIQEMVKGEEELFAGVNVEGKIKMLEFGDGGRKVDIYNKIGGTKAAASTNLHPLTKNEIKDLIESTPINVYFDTHLDEKNKAYRGMEPINMDFMVDQLSCIDCLARELPVKNINLNPYRTSKNDPLHPKAVDGRIILDLEEAKKWLSA